MFNTKINFGINLAETKSEFESLEKVFKKEFNKQLQIGNQQAVTEGIAIMREIVITRIPTATSNERIDRTINNTIDYINKWTA